MYKQSIKDKAIELRKEGYSYSHISFKIDVAKSTLSEWLKNIPFLPNEITYRNIIKNNERIVSISRVDKLKSIKDADIYAKGNLGTLSKRDHFIFGLGIYLGEGSKIGDYIRISNSDPRIIKFSIDWFKKHFGLGESNFRLRIHIYPDNDEDKIIKFWINAVSLKREAFFSSYIDGRLNKKKDRAGVLPYGTAHLSIVSNGKKDFGVLLHRKIIASIDFALEQ
jgi:hypothetical protein